MKRAKKTDRPPAREGPVGIATVGRDIFILGGSGDVGKRLTRLLLENTSASVTAFSRRQVQKAEKPGGRLRHVSRDLSSGEMLETSQNALVVNLTEATPPALARQIIKSGGWFLETSATPAYLSAITDALRDITGPGTAILCVGAAPGLTNLLAAEMRAKAPDIEHIDIGLEMGMGRHYGAAGTEWFLRTAGKPYSVVVDHALKNVTPGQLRRKFAFGEEGPLRHALGYGFAEQTLIADGADLPLKTVRSFVALQPAWMTRALGLLLSLGMGPAIGRNAHTLTKWLLRTPAIGWTRSRLIVEGFDSADQLIGRIRLETGDQAEATAAIIFATIENVMKHREHSRSNVTTISDHVHLDTALEVLRQVLPDTRVTLSFADEAGDRTGTSK